MHPCCKPYFHQAHPAFDDIFAELDAEHSSMVRSLVGDGLQVFVASPKPDVAEIWPELTQLEGFGRAHEAL